jgi:hypothetical protein
MKNIEASYAENAAVQGFGQAFPQKAASLILGAQGKL